MWKSIVDPNNKRQYGALYAILRATDSQSEYVMLIAFPRQQWLRERASLSIMLTLPSLFSLFDSEIHE
jgi:hypothetical protein